jgi:hypothetical protein
MKLFKYLVIVILCSLPSLAAAYDYNAFGSEQDDCFAKAMVGMDSVINSRLGVPPEHALDLTLEPRRAGSTTDEYDSNTLNIILAAYLWKETPHTYAIKVFFNCAQKKAYNKQAMAK